MPGQKLHHDSLAVIADDLTGACELAGIARKHGIHSTVYLCWENIPFSAESIPVLNTESRHCSQEEAALRVQRAYRVLQQAGYNRFYKKCDSVLRGNIGAELIALHRSSGIKRLIYGPAFPSAGRTVNAGLLMVDGAPVAESVFANDPLSPVGESRISSLIGRQHAEYCVTECCLETALPPAGIMIFDGQKDDDLMQLAHRCQGERCFAGPGLFFEALATTLYPPKELPTCYIPPQKWLVTVGSQHPVSFNQLAALIAHGAECLQILPRHLVEQPGNFMAPPDWADRARQAWSENRCVVLYTAQNLDELPAYRSVGQSMGMQKESFSRLLTNALAVATMQLAMDCHPCLLVCGGETAFSLAQCLQISSLEALKAPAAGVTFLRGDGPNGEQLLVTKNGAFGAADLLVNLTEMLL